MVLVLLLNGRCYSCDLTLCEFFGDVITSLAAEIAASLGQLNELDGYSSSSCFLLVIYLQMDVVAL